MWKFWQKTEQPMIYPPRPTFFLELPLNGNVVISARWKPPENSEQCRVLGLEIGALVMAAGKLHKVFHEAVVNYCNMSEHGMEVLDFVSRVVQFHADGNDGSRLVVHPRETFAKGDRNDNRG